MSDQPTNLNCPACGAPLDPDGTSTIVRCKFCGNVSLLPNEAGTSASTLEAIRQLLGGGNLTGAIEHYRQTYGVDLSEAQQAVEALQAGRMVTSSMPGTRSAEELTRTLEQVQRLLSAGNKIEAIKLYRGTFDVSLERAKDAIDQIEAGQTVRPAGSPAEPGTPIQKTKSSRSRGCLGAGIIGVVIVFIVGLIIYFVVQAGIFNIHYSIVGPVTLVPSAAGSAPDFAAEFYKADKDTRFIGLVDGSTHKLRWQAASLSGSGNASALVSGSDLVYTANGTDLLAYHVSDGSLAWQTVMPDSLSGEGTALLVTAGRVITDNADQTIQAYDAQTGSPAWNRRLTGGDSGLRLMGNSLVVIDQTDNNSTDGLVFLDPASGDQQNVVTPSCTYNGDTSSLDTSAGLIYDSTENALFLVYDSSYGCVQRLDMTTGKVLWEADSPDSFDFTPDGFQALMTDSTLYFNNGNDVLAVNKSTGQMKTLLSNPDYTILPLSQTGNDLIVRAYRTRGTGRFELWGVDATSGSSVWQMNLHDAQPIDPPDVMAGLIDNTDTGYTWKLMPAGLVLVKFQGQPNQITLQTFDPTNDNQLGSSTIPLNNVSGDFYDIPTVLAWQNTVVYLNLDGSICALDLATHKLTVIY